MKPRICICCGEPMAESSHGLSRNPNVCASCSSMADGIGETILPEAPEPAVDLPLSVEAGSPPATEASEEVVVEWTSGRVLKRK